VADALLHAEEPRRGIGDSAVYGAVTFIQILLALSPNLGWGSGAVVRCPVVASHGGISNRAVKISPFMIFI